MSTSDQLRRNSILNGLPDAEFERLRDAAEVMDAEVRHRVYAPGEQITDVYFPLSCVCSVFALADEEVLVQVATEGDEGMVGLPFFLGATSSPHAAFCQVPGMAARVSTGDLQRVLSDDGALHRRLNRLTQATMVQVAQN